MIINAEVGRLIGIAIAALVGYGFGWVFGEHSGFQTGVMRGIDEYIRLKKEYGQSRKR